MIQTQLLRLDPPYQIISAQGYVGIQVATLIVTTVVEPSPQWSKRSSIYAEHHSYPVVNYGLKQGLEEQMKYNRTYLDEFEEYQLRRRMQPEGAVWSGVDVKDVRVLGLAGANNSPIELDYFVYLIPTVQGFDPYLHVWDKTSTSRIYDFYTGLGNVGLKTQSLTAVTHRTFEGDEVDERKEYRIRLTLENMMAHDGYCVKVLIRENTEFIPGKEDNSIYFRCIVNPSNEDSIIECAATIAEGLNGLSFFLPTQNLKLIADNNLPDTEGYHAGFMNQLISQINENYKNY